MEIIIKEAKICDIPSIVLLLADDVIGSKREDITLPLKQFYIDAFKEISNNPNCYLIVAKQNDNVVGTLQVSIMPGISRKGMFRAEIEGVRVNNKFRGKKIGLSLCEWAIKKAKMKKCGIIQLTSDKKRLLAHKFYENIGFESSHTGMKMFL